MTEPNTVVLISVVGGATDEQLADLERLADKLDWADETVVWNDVEPGDE